MTRLNSQENDSNSSDNKKDKWLQSGYDTIDGYERFLYSKKQRKKNKQKDISFRRKINANNNFYREKYYMSNSFIYDDDNSDGDSIERENTSVISNRKINVSKSKKYGHDDDEDGYRDMMKKKKERPFIKRLFMAPIQIGVKVTKKLMNKVPEPGTLILVRHGESEWNANKTFTGWADPSLSEQGIRETEHAARLLLAGGYDIDVVFTSRLKRAIRSTWIVLGEMNQLYLPVFKSWRLNERMYGALTGLCKKQTAEKLGPDLVQAWRGSLVSRPPPVTVRDEHWPGRDRRYSDLPFEQIPLSESLLDCMARTEPVWEDKIKWELRRGRNVMVVSHANTLRGLVKLIDGIGDEEIQEVALPTGIPIVYKFDKLMNPVKPKGDKYLSQQHMKGVFLEKPGILNAALKKEKEWCENVPGYNTTMTRSKNGMTSLERSLTKLNAEKELREWAAQSIDIDDIEEDDGSDGNLGKPIKFEDQVVEPVLEELRKGGQLDTEEASQSDESENQESDTETDDDDEIVNPVLIKNNPCINALPTQYVTGFGDVPTRRDPVVVLIRHGKTEHNKLGLFTGWEDAPLAREGKEEARQAGKLLKAHGFEFDVVYTSWLSRAIETAWLVMEEMDCTWLPIIKTWRLNERMYGALTGKSKAMVEQKYGAKQFKAWRRGHTVKPPPVSSFSVDFPGNDIRYRHLNDIRISISETIMRSFDSGTISIHRKLPKSESLKDCMDRTIPYYQEQIAPKAINDGKRILISSSENAIRGLLMTLCDIPEDKISELEIPNGLPMIYDLKSRCIKLLDDGSGDDPLKKYSFGNAASYLFRPCIDDDGDVSDDCDITFMSDAVYTLTDSDIEFAQSLRQNNDALKEVSSS